MCLRVFVHVPALTEMCLRNVSSSAGGKVRAPVRTQWKFRNLLGVFSGCLLVLLGWCSIQTYSINIKSLGMLWWFLMNDHIIHQCDGLCYETTNCQFRWAQHVLTHVPSNLCWSLALPQRFLTIVTKPSTNFQSYLSLSRPHRIQKGQKTILDENQPLVNQLIN